MTLTKAHVVQAFAEQNGYPNKQSFNTVKTLLEIIKKTLESGEDVMISGFGKFCVKEKKQRRGRNPATGEDMMLEPIRGKKGTGTLCLTQIKANVIKPKEILV